MEILVVRIWGLDDESACLRAVHAAWAIDDYQLGPDSMRQDGVPRGKVSEHDWKDSKVFPGTERKYWVYVLAKHDAAKPANQCMVFQDGQSFVSETGSYPVPIVFDNLIHKHRDAGDDRHSDQSGRFPADNAGRYGRGDNRSIEYDRVSDDYARFLLEEILPEVGKEL